MSSTGDGAIEIFGRGLGTLLLCGTALVLGSNCDSGSSTPTTFAAPICTVDATKPLTGQCGAAPVVTPPVKTNGCANTSDGKKYCDFCAASTASPCTYCPTDTQCPADPCGTECTSTSSTTAGSTTGASTGGSTTGGTGGTPPGVTCSNSQTCVKGMTCKSCTYYSCACSTSCGLAAWYSSSDGQIFGYETCGNQGDISGAAQAVLKHCGCI